DKFQTAVRAFLKKYQYKNAEWTDLVREFETASGQDLKDWANGWVKQRGMPIYKSRITKVDSKNYEITTKPQDILNEGGIWKMKTKGILLDNINSEKRPFTILFDSSKEGMNEISHGGSLDHGTLELNYFFPK